MKKLYDPFLTLEEAADYLQISGPSMNRYIREGAFPVYRIAGEWKVRQAELLSWTGEYLPPVRKK
jgi:excisionase family DNA binding protein